MSDPSSVSDQLRGRPTCIVGSKPIGEQQFHHLVHCVGCNRSNDRDPWFSSAPNPCHTWSHAIEFPIRLSVAVVEPSLATAKADDKFQFERHGYFAADRVDHAVGKLVFNLAVGLKDSWAK